MPRPPRADESGGLYHALNRGNGREEIFHKPEDYTAFERILGEGLVSYDVRLFCFQLMPNHWHLVLRPNADGELSRFMRWITATHTMRYRAHYHTSGEGHVYQGRFKSFPIQDDGHFCLPLCRAKRCSCPTGQAGGRLEVEFTLAMDATDRSRPGVVVAVANSSLPELGRSGQRAPGRKGTCRHPQVRSQRESAWIARMDATDRRTTGSGLDPPKSRSPASPFSGIPRRKHHQ